MIRLMSRAVLLLACVFTGRIADARQLSPDCESPTHYTVRFGAVIGELEPIAGEMLCARDKDCIILLSFSPKIEIRLHALSSTGKTGIAEIDCEGIGCHFAFSSRLIPYDAPINRLKILQGDPGGNHDLVLRIYPKWPPIGTFDFSIEQARQRPENCRNASRL